MKSFEDREEQTFHILKTVYKKALANLDIRASENELRLHHAICSRKIFSKFSHFQECCSWLENLQLENNQKMIYNTQVFNDVLADQFFFLSKKASGFGLKTVFFFIKKSRKNNWSIKPIAYSKLALRCVLKYDKFEFKLT